MHSTVTTEDKAVQAFQNLEDELGFDFGPPATSARTSRSDFTPATLTGFADASPDHTNNTLGDNARSARASAGNAAIPRAGGSADNEATRGTPSQKDIDTERTGSSVTTADPRSFAWNSAGAQRLDMRAVSLRRAAPFVGGGCGSEVAQESPDLAGNWQGSGGLFGATAAEEAEEAKSGAGWLHHQDAANNISKYDMGGSLGGGGGASSDGDQQQMSQRLLVTQ